MLTSVYHQILRDDPAAATRHVEGGIRILTEQFEQPSHLQSCSAESLMRPRPTAVPALDALRLIFSRLDFQTSLFRPQKATASAPQPNRGIRYFDASELISAPRPFESVSHARTYLDCLSHNSIRLVRLPSADLDAGEAEALMKMKSDAIQDFLHWSSACRAVLGLNDCIPASLNGKRAVGILRVREICKDILLVCASTGGEIACDDCLSLFEEIIVVTEQLLQPLPNDGSPLGRQEAKATFCLRNEVNIPLFLVAWKCRNSAIRRHAIRLLERRRTTEGVWSSAFLARLARRIVEVEEHHVEQSSKDSLVPADARVKTIAFTLDQAGYGNAQVYFVKDHERIK